MVSHNSKLINIFNIAIASGLFLAILWHLCLLLLGFEYPFNTFLFDPADRFNDLFNSITSSKNLNPYAEPSPAVPAYFPFSYIIFYTLSFLTRDAVLFTFSGLLIIMALYLSSLVADTILPHQKYRNFTKILFLLLFSYPSIYSFDRGNLDIFIAYCIALFVIKFNSRNYIKSTFFITIAMLLKGYPALFLLYPIVKKNLRMPIVAICIFLFASFFSLFIFDGGASLNFVRFINALAIYKETYVIGFAAIKYLSDPYDFVRALLIFWNNKEWYLLHSKIILTVYHYFSTFCLLTIVYTAIKYRADCFRVILCLTCGALLFPDVTSDYKFSLLILPIIELLRYETINKYKTMLFIMPIITCMIPKKYIYVDGVAILQYANALSVLLLFVYSCSNKLYIKFTKDLFVPRCLALHSS